MDGGVSMTSEVKYTYIDSESSKITRSLTFRLLEGDNENSLWEIKAETTDGRKGANSHIEVPVEQRNLRRVCKDVLRLMGT